MKTNVLKGLLLASSLLSSVSLVHAADVTLTVESWRNDDLQIWQEKIIPAFEAKNPGIKIVFSPTAPTEYNASLNAKLDAGSAGDIITCRPFDASLDLFNKKRLADLTSLPGIENFSAVAKAAWSTDDGKSTFCVPMASVIHGFIYNKDAFDKLGLKVPATRDEFFVERFTQVMNDDFGTPEACAVLFEMVREINRLRESDLNAAAGLAARLKELASVLGVLQLEADDFLQAGAEGRVDAAEVEALIQARLTARANKDWAESDRIRDQLTAMGVVLEDGKGGTTWRLAD